MGVSRTELTIRDYQAVLDNIDDGIFVVGSDGIILQVNKAVKKTAERKSMS